MVRDAERYLLVFTLGVASGALGAWLLGERAAPALPVPLEPARLGGGEQLALAAPRTERATTAQDLVTGRTPVTDAGANLALTAARRLSRQECASELLRDSASILRWAREAHESRRSLCLQRFDPVPGPRARVIPDPTATCGDFSESLWSVTADDLAGLIHLVDAFGPDTTDRPLFRGLTCDSMDAPDFGAALHVAVVAPRFVDVAFLRCAVLRTSSEETFAFWSALDATEHLPESRSWIPNREFLDERTLRRVQPHQPFERRSPR
ncbi:MAG: hypothetical protein OHK0013_45800 [Sandaracinaceae bacterium]